MASPLRTRSREAPYSGQQEIIQTLKDARPKTVDPNKESSRVQGASASEDDSGPKDYKKILQMMGRSSHSAMQELFYGSGLPPTISDTAVTISFEMFQSVQERLVSTRTELEKNKDAVMAANQRAATMQMQAVADRERVLNVEKKLEQVTDYAQSLRKTNAELNMSLQAKEGERLRLDEALGKARQEMSTQATKIADLNNELGLTKAMSTRLENQLQLARAETKALADRHQEQLNAVTQGAAAAAKRAGGEMKIAALSSQLAKLRQDLEEAAHDRDAEHARLRHARHSMSLRCAAVEVSAMSWVEKANHHARRATDLLSQLDAANATIKEHEERDRQRQQLVAASQRRGAEGDVSLPHVLEQLITTKATIDGRQLPPQGAPGSLMNGIVDAAADAVSGLAGAAQEAVRMLSRMDGVMLQANGLDEVLPAWVDAKSRCAGVIARYATSGAEGFAATLKSSGAAEAAAMLQAQRDRDGYWEEKIAREYVRRVPTCEAGMMAVALVAHSQTGHERGVPTQSYLSGMTNTGAVTEVSKDPHMLMVERDMWTDVGYKVPDWVLRLTQAPADLQARPTQLFTELPTRFAAFHSRLNALLNLLRKRMQLQVGNTVDPLGFADRFGVPLDVSDCWQVIKVDEDLVMTMIAAIINSKEDAVRRLAIHRLRAEIHAKDRSIDHLKKLSRSERETAMGFAERQDLSQYRSQRGGMVSDVRGAHFDDAALLEAVAAELNGDGVAMMTPPEAAVGGTDAAPTSDTEKDGLLSDADTADFDMVTPDAATIAEAPTADAVAQLPQAAAPVAATAGKAVRPAKPPGSKAAGGTAAVPPKAVATAVGAKHPATTHGRTTAPPPAARGLKQVVSAVSDVAKAAAQLLKDTAPKPRRALAGAAKSTAALRGVAAGDGPLTSTGEVATAADEPGEEAEEDTTRSPPQITAPVVVPAVVTDASTQCTVAVAQAHVQTDAVAIEVLVGVSPLAGHYRHVSPSATPRSDALEAPPRSPRLPPGSTPPNPRSISPQGSPNAHAGAKVSARIALESSSPSHHHHHEIHDPRDEQRDDFRPRRRRQTARGGDSDDLATAAAVAAAGDVEEDDEQDGPFADGGDGIADRSFTQTPPPPGKRASIKDAAAADGGGHAAPRARKMSLAPRPDPHGRTNLPPHRHPQRRRSVSLSPDEGAGSGGGGDDGDDGDGDMEASTVSLRTARLRRRSTVTRDALEAQQNHKWVLAAAPNGSDAAASVADTAGSVSGIVVGGTSKQLPRHSGTAALGLDSAGSSAAGPRSSSSRGAAGKSSPSRGGLPSTTSPATNMATAAAMHLNAVGRKVSHSAEPTPAAVTPRPRPPPTRGAPVSATSSGAVRASNSADPAAAVVLPGARGATNGGPPATPRDLDPEVQSALAYAAHLRAQKPGTAAAPIGSLAGSAGLPVLLRTAQPRQGSPQLATVVGTRKSPRSATGDAVPLGARTARALPQSAVTGAQPRALRSDAAGGGGGGGVGLGITGKSPAPPTSPLAPFDGERGTAGKSSVSPSSARARPNAKAPSDVGASNSVGGGGYSSLLVRRPAGASPTRVGAAGPRSVNQAAADLSNLLWSSPPPPPTSRDVVPIRTVSAASVWEGGGATARSSEEVGMRQRPAALSKQQLLQPLLTSDPAPQAATAVTPVYLRGDWHVPPPPIAATAPPEAVA